jgi:hypothetical protein
VNQPLGLTICLQVDASRKAVMDAVVAANSVPKSTGKLFALIGGDTAWDTLFADHLFEKHPC